MRVRPIFLSQFADLALRRLSQGDVARVRRQQVPERVTCVPAVRKDCEDMDMVMVGPTIAFFALSFAYIRACDSL